MPRVIMPGWIRNKLAVKRHDRPVKNSRKRFFDPAKSASVPRNGPLSSTTMAAMVSATPHSRVPSPPPTTLSLK